MLTRAPPLPPRHPCPPPQGNKKATIHEILHSEPALPSWMSDGATHFIKWSLTKDKRMRPSVPQLADHPWVVGHIKMAVPRVRMVNRTGGGGRVPGSMWSTGQEGGTGILSLLGGRVRGWEGG